MFVFEFLRLVAVTVVSHLLLLSWIKSINVLERLVVCWLAGLWMMTLDSRAWKEHVLSRGAGWGSWSSV